MIIILAPSHVLRPAQETPYALLGLPHADDSLSGSPISAADALLLAFR
jgi:hypothetical protein